jgi:glyoxylase-like metal-dependent hydrolase (beta-lactamase superfamily II)
MTLQDPRQADRRDGTWEAYAIRYARLDERRRADNFVPVDPHDGPMPMDYFVWLLRQGGRTILVDTGFGAEAASARGRKLLRCPIEALRVLDVDPASVSDVVITHLHYDHAGNLDKLPNARFHIQADEVSYATGPCMCHPAIRHAYRVEDVVELVRKVYADRVVFYQGDANLAPGVDLLAIGGHTMGLQSLRVRTARGTVILASDASHYYENILGGRPFPIVHDVAKMLDGHRRLLAEAGDPKFLVPGHDPLVLERYPQVPGDEIGIAILHEPPTA